MTTPPTTNELALDLEALEKLCEAATPGPWKWTEDRYGNFDSLDAPPELHKHVLFAEPVGYENSTVLIDPNDALLIAAARTALPALIERVRVLERCVDSWENSSANADKARYDRVRALEAALEKFGDHAVANVDRVEHVTIYACAVADGKGCDCGYDAALNNRTDGGGR